MKVMRVVLVTVRKLPRRALHLLKNAGPFFAQGLSVQEATVFYATLLRPASTLHRNSMPNALMCKITD